MRVELKGKKKIGVKSRKTKISFIATMHASKRRRDLPKGWIRRPLSCRASCQRGLYRNGGSLGRPIWIVPAGSGQPANSRFSMGNRVILNAGARSPAKENTYRQTHECDQAIPWAHTTKKRKSSPRHTVIWVRLCEMIRINEGSTSNESIR
jgi:hypothetical protein